MSTLPPGTLIDDRHRVDRVLGEGGFATVYAGTDTVAGRGVAIKVLRAESSRERARFAREIQIVAGLRDPHTVRLFAYGETEDAAPYIVFEHINGQDLAEVLAECDKLSPAVVGHLLRQVLESVREAHVAGVLHRDLKPENIRVYNYMGDPWSVKVLDFGLGRAIEQERGTPKLTATGEVIGTPRYMSPEALVGRPLSPASDIYAIGLVGLEMLVGRASLHGNSWPDQIERMRTGHLFAVQDGTSAGKLGELLQRMTTRDPARRVPTAQAALTALNAMGSLDDIETSDNPAARPVAEATSTQRVAFEEARVESRAPWALAVGAALAALAVGAFFSGWGESPPDVKSVRRPVSVTVPVPKARPPMPDVGATSALAPDVREEPARGCGVEAPFEGRGEFSTTSGIEEHRWAAYLPDTYDPLVPHPLVILLHRSWDNPVELFEGSGFATVADRHGFVVLMPTGGYPESWKAPNATGRLEAMAELTADEVCIDPERVFLVGHSQGGGLAERLSCAPWVKGVAVISHRARNTGSRCAERSLPMIFLSPLESLRIPFDGGPNCDDVVRASVADVEAFWRERNSCKSASEQTFRSGRNICRAWDCATPFESCHMDGGDGWPGVDVHPAWALAPKCADAEPADFPAAERIGAFLAAIGTVEASE